MFDFNKQGCPKGMRLSKATKRNLFSKKTNSLNKEVFRKLHPLLDSLVLIKIITFFQKLKKHTIRFFLNEQLNN